ncbi:unnamed protein product, partial [Choristocarpus tenellus]
MHYFVLSHLRRLADGGSLAGTANVFGDNQLEVDLRSDAIIFNEFKRCRAVSTAASEEKPEEIDMGGDALRCYSVGFDPLDGSSIIDANFAVGSIFGIWPGKGLCGRLGREQVASCMSTYGPRTTMALALGGEVTGGDPVAFEVTFVGSKWMVTCDRFCIAPTGK